MIFLLTAVGGCDTDFNPFETEAVQFSVFGYLDASADTQWIRVMPIRNSVIGPDEFPETTVTLEHLGTGRTVTLRDSVFPHRVPFLNPDAEVLARNFWTTEPVEPGAQYEFTITREDGATSATTVQIPEEYTVVVSHHSFSPVLATARIEGVEHLAIVHVREIVGERVCYASYFPVPAATAPGVYQMPLTRSVPPELDCGLKEDIFVVSSGSQWQLGPEFSVGALDVPSTISNGVGFLVGIVSRAIPWEACTLTSSSEPCQLIYNSDSATLKGTIVDLVCGGPIVQAEVEMREVLPDPNAPTRVRTTLTDLDGSYRIDALEGGVPHALRVIPPQPVYGAHEDTLTFQTGESVTSNIALQRAASC